MRISQPSPPDNSVTGAKIVDGAVTLSKLSTESVNSDKVVATISSEGSQVIPATTRWTPPHGLYNMIAGITDITVEIYVGGSWRLGYAHLASALYCDGTNVRIYNYGAVSTTVYYQRV